MTSKKKIIVPIFILAIGLLGFFLVWNFRPTPQPKAPERQVPMVRTIQPIAVSHQYIVRSQGSVVPRTESDLIPQISGEVTWVSDNFVAGGFFHKDELLVEIDSADYLADLESARASVARSQSEFSRAKKQRSRQQLLAKESVTSQAKIDDAENAYRVSVAALREAKARLTRATRDLARTKISAPYAGRVRSKSIDVGQFANRGNSIARLYAVDYVEIKLPIPDHELRFINLPLAYHNKSDNGQIESLPAVRIHADFAGERKIWQGKIVRTEGEIDPKSRMINLIARISDPYGREQTTAVTPLPVGLFVEAEILGKTVENVFVLPREAIHDAGTPDQYRISIMSESGRLQYRNATLLRANREKVIITSDIKREEKIVISPLTTAIEGMQIRSATLETELENTNHSDALAPSL